MFGSRVTTVAVVLEKDLGKGWLLAGWENGGPVALGVERRRI